MKVRHNTIGVYKDGEIVFAKKDPKIPLIVRRFVDSIYYCKFQEHPNQRELALFEREIIAKKQ